MKEKDDLETIISELWQREKAYKDALNTQADTTYAFKMALAEAMRKGDDPVTIREKMALTTCKREYEAYLKAEAVAGFTKEMLKDVQMVLSARQSLLSAEIKTEFGGMYAGRSA